ncbi:STAS domain-containing protein [Fictibacillus aquaticus]|uniref:Anti-anti-sigma factor n=1 Tax=Fictibacillus aquaticus TaxID=2021314 RepID=A0A235F5F4_9BACL|nr:STAS domain-containing protein [Fictibacillus aquaticus]OYD56536.1 anti-anti-sigma factor [Fictibacillus aquaticus]
MLTKQDTFTLGDIKFTWDLDEGHFTFQGSDVVLFWIDSAMKTLFDTIEEISGDDAASVVMETTGHRQGEIVGDFFKSLNLSLEKSLEAIPPLYATAGWGKVTFEELDIETSRVIVTLKNSWEYKINKAQGKMTHGSFLPGHFAGLLSKLFNTNIWYETLQGEVGNDPCCVFSFFPSDMTSSKNMHELLRKKEQDEIRKLEEEVEKRTEELKSLIQKLSSPIIPVLENIVVIPLIGNYDDSRAEELLTKTLESLPKLKSKFLILDLTGMDTDGFDASNLYFIERLSKAAALLGSESILVGISAELGIAITREQVDLSALNCFGTLQHGIYYALSQEGRKII